MSIHFADSNVGLPSTAIRYDLPAGAGAKAATTAAVFGCFFQSQERGWENGQPSAIACRGTGSASTNDIYWRLPQACTSIEYRVRQANADLIVASSLAGLTAGVKYLLLFIVNPTNVHVVAAPVDGGTPLRATHATTAVYDANMATVPMVERIGGTTSASVYGWVGPLEHAFMCVGEFPESGGIPDATLITNLATGVQDIGTLDTQLTGGAKRFWYPMRHSRDVADAYGIAGNLTLVNENRPVGLLQTNGVQLRPEAVRPADALWCVSQATIPTPGSMVGAQAPVPVQGGTYTGISPVAVQARLVKEDGTTHVDWTQTATCAGGSWAAGVLANVPMTAGLLHLDIRAVDGSGVQIGDIHSGGARGVGFHMLTSGQSQQTYYFETGTGQTLPSGSRGIFVNQKATGMRRALVGSISGNNRLGRKGWRQAVAEIDAIYPGVPVQLATVGESGVAITDFLTGGLHVGRWAAMASRYGVTGPLYFGFMGHSSAADATYQTKYTDMIALADAQFPQAIKVINFPVPRLKRGGTSLSGSALQVHHSRLGMRNWHEANRGRSVWGSSFAVLHAETGEASATQDPHPADTTSGQGRGGAIMAWVLMSAANAVNDEVIGLVSATGLGTSTHTLTFGRVNNTR